MSYGHLKGRQANPYQSNYKKITMEQTKQHKRAEDINVSYEEALKLAPPPIKRKDTAQRGADTQG